MPDEKETAAILLVSQMLDERASRHFEKARKFDRDKEKIPEDSTKERRSGHYVRSAALYVKGLLK